MAMINPDDHVIEIHNNGSDQRDIICSCSWDYTVTDEVFIESVVMRHKIENGVVVYDNDRKQWIEIG